METQLENNSKSVPVFDTTIELINTVNSGLKRDEKGRLVKGTGPGPGRPKDSVSLITILKEKLETISPDNKRSAAEVLVENIIQDALDNNNDMRKLIFNYLEGMPKQQVEQSGGTMNLNIEMSNEQFTRLIRERAEQLNSGEGSQRTTD